MYSLAKPLVIGKIRVYNNIIQLPNEYTYFGHCYSVPVKRSATFWDTSFCLCTNTVLLQCRDLLIVSLLHMLLLILQFPNYSGTLTAGSVTVCVRVGSQQQCLPKDRCTNSIARPMQICTNIHSNNTTCYYTQQRVSLTTIHQ